MPLFAFFSIGPTEWIVLGIVAVLLFGSRLPEVARNVGKGFVEFKKGLRGIEDEINTAATSRRTSHDNEINDREEPTAPRFAPPTAEPQAQSAPTSSEPADQNEPAPQA